LGAALFRLGGPGGAWVRRGARQRTPGCAAACPDL